MNAWTVDPYAPNFAGFHQSASYNASQVLGIGPTFEEGDLVTAMRVDATLIAPYETFSSSSEIILSVVHGIYLAASTPAGVITDAGESYWFVWKGLQPHSEPRVAWAPSSDTAGNFVMLCETLMWRGRYKCPSSMTMGYAYAQGGTPTGTLQANLTWSAQSPSYV